MTGGTFLVVYNVLLFAGVAVATLIVVLTWPRRQTPGSRSLTILLIAEAWWTLCYALQLADAIHPGSDPDFWGKIMYLGIVMIPACFLVWSARYTNRDGWLNRHAMALLFVEPILFTAIIWIAPRQGVLSGVFANTGIPAIPFWVHTVYSYALLTTATVMHVLNWIHMPPVYKRQALLIMLGLIVANAANLFSINVLLPRLNLDLSPLGLLLATFIFAYAQLRHRLFDLLPVARHAVVEGMRDGVMVLDTLDRIIDMNPVAQGILDRHLRDSLGKAVSTVFPFWPEIRKNLTNRKDTNLEFPLEGGKICNIELAMTILYDKRQQPSGKVIVLRDVTHVKRIETELREANNDLVRKLAKIEQLQAKLKEETIRDPLTGLYNRRFLEETLNHELAAAKRKHESLSIAMIDLDRFKEINDKYGHNTGDLFLIALGDMLTTKTRAGDLACRFGGEEFVIIMPDVSLEIVVQRVDALRLIFSGISIDAGKEKAGGTFSAGISCYPQHGSDDKTLLSAADRALYAAKAAGRNRVIVADNASI